MRACVRARARVCGVAVRCFASVTCHVYPYARLSPAVLYWLVITRTRMHILSVFLTLPPCEYPGLSGPHSQRVWGAVLASYHQPLGRFPSGGFGRDV